MSVLLERLVVRHCTRGYEVVGSNPAELFFFLMVLSFPSFLCLKNGSFFGVKAKREHLLGVKLGPGANFMSKKLRGIPPGEFNIGQLSENCECYPLCYEPPPPFYSTLRLKDYLRRPKQV